MSADDVADIQSVIIQLIKDLCPGNAEKMTNKSHLANDLGYHSLALVELAFALEDKFDLEPIDQVTAKSIQTVGDIVNYVTGKVTERAVSQEA